MKLRTLSLLCITVVVVSCNKKDNNSSNHLVYSDVIIGCKTGGNVVAAIDPIKSNEIAFKSVIDGGVLVGPSAVSTDFTRYYTIGADKKMDEINTSNGEIIRSFQLSNFCSFIFYDLQQARILCLSSTNVMYDFGLYSISLSSGSESFLGTIHLDMGIPTGTGFLRNGNIYLLSGNDLMCINPNTLVKTKVKTLTGITNSLKYDSKLDKVFYMHSKDVKTFSLFCYDFNTNQNIELKNYSNIQTILLNSTSYNESNGHYYFYNADRERITIDVNTLNCKFEQVEYPLINTEVIRGNLYVPSEVIES